MEKSESKKTSKQYCQRRIENHTCDDSMRRFCLPANPSCTHEGKNHQSTPPDNIIQEVEVLTVHELSQFLKRSPAAIRNLVLRRRVPFRKAGGRITFLRHEIHAWLEQSEGLAWDEYKSGARQ